MFEMRSKNQISKMLLSTMAVVGLVAGYAHAEHHEKKEAEPEYLKCEISFEYKSWAAFFGKGQGEGKVSCNNGQTADVVIEHKSIGVALGTSNVDHGHGDFAYVTDIDDVFGEYSGSGATVAAGATADVGGLIKRDSKVKLGFTGTGEGGAYISRAWGGVTISRKK